ncbi:MAG: 1-carboxybiuret hydrolase subunit AtzE [Chroococcopsis gigantea SAG 12.99]|nr:1-carboxybiuret hydrolase subunit AtzE [Chroococcopsis gigantea SAG 12.99]
MEITSAVEIAKNIQTGQITAVKIIEATLEQIEAQKHLNCFTAIFSQKALREAESIDRKIGRGEAIGPLAGVPFGVKNLFDIAGVVTLAGAKINQDYPPATHSAFAVRELEKAGAILVGALNMDEYAYGFVTRNSHYGPTLNPLDPKRIAGGSSGGSASAVGAKILPLSLGSDTNGSIRVPAACCGVLGFKPTYGRLSRGGVFLFSSSLDHIGLFANGVKDLALAFDGLQGYDESDPVCTLQPPQTTSPFLEDGIESVRIAIADGYFTQGAQAEVLEAVENVGRLLGVTRRVMIPESERARAAAFIITAVEGANLHLERLRHRLHDFDPATRDRFLAGALIPGSWYIQAQRFRVWYRQRLREILGEVDLILAPTIPCVAPLLSQETVTISGEDILIRPYLGRFTQPLSFIGLPVLSYPIRTAEGLSIGVQIIGAPYREKLILQVARILEKCF